MERARVTRERGRPARIGAEGGRGAGRCACERHARVRRRRLPPRGQRSRETDEVTARAAYAAIGAFTSVVIGAGLPCESTYRKPYHATFSWSASSNVRTMRLSV